MRRFIGFTPDSRFALIGRPPRPLRPGVQVYSGSPKTGRPTRAPLEDARHIASRTQQQPCGLRYASCGTGGRRTRAGTGPASCCSAAEALGTSAPPPRFRLGDGDSVFAGIARGLLAFAFFVPLAGVDILLARARTRLDDLLAH